MWAPATCLHAWPCQNLSLCLLSLTVHQTQKLMLSSRSRPASHCFKHSAGPCDMAQKEIYTLIYGCAGSLVAAWTLSSCSEQGLLSNCGAQAPSCSGFSCCGTRALGHVGFSSCGMEA